MLGTLIIVALLGGQDVPFAKPGAGDQLRQSSAAVPPPLNDVLGVWHEIERAEDDWGCTPLHRFTLTRDRLLWESAYEDGAWSEEESTGYNIAGRRIHSGRISIEAKGSLAVIFNEDGDAVCDLRR